MIKYLSLIAAVALVSFSVQAAEQAAAIAVVKGTKAYQSRAISNMRPADEAQPAPENPASVEPAAGVEAQGEMSSDPAQDTTSKLQQQMKLPRKN